MQFRVGPYLYIVRPVAGYIHHEGEPCLGLCDNEKHELLISDQASPAQQIQVACHEYMEAWVYHFGANLTDKEAYCDLFGLAMTQFVMDFIRDLRPLLKPEAALAVGHLMADDSRSQQDAPPDLASKCNGSLAEDQEELKEARPFKVTHIYEPSPAGSTEPWLMRVMASSKASPGQTQ